MILKYLMNIKYIFPMGIKNIYYTLTKKYTKKTFRNVRNKQKIAFYFVLRTVMYEREKM